MAMSMKHTLYYTCILLFICTSLFGDGNRTKKSKTADVTEDLFSAKWVSCISIIVMPDRYLNQEVVIHGFIGCEEGREDILYSDRDSAKYGLLENGIYMDRKHIKPSDDYDMDKVRKLELCFPVYGTVIGKTNILVAPSTTVTLPVVRVRRIMNPFVPFIKQKNSQTYDDNGRSLAGSHIVSIYALLLDTKIYKHKNVIVTGYLVHETHGFTFLTPTYENVIYGRFEYFLALNTNKCENYGDFVKAKQMYPVNHVPSTFMVRYDGEKLDLSGRFGPTMPQLSLIRVYDTAPQ